MIRSSIAVIVLGALALNTAGRSAQAQFSGGSSSSGNLEGFTVSGKGAIAARPNRLEIDLEVSAFSEMTSDVIVKYRDAKKRIQEAFVTLKMANVTIEERSLGVDKKGQVFNPYMMDTPPVKKGKVEVQLTRKLVINCVGIRDLDEEALLQLVAKLLDVAQDAGAKVGPQSEFNPYYYRMSNQASGLVRFIVDDYDALVEKAYQEAITDARTRAGRLARLSGVELGPVVGVREILIPGEKVSSQSFSFYGSDTPTEEEMPKKRLEASKFQEMPIKVELQVRFTSATPLKAAARDGGQ